MVGLAKVGLAKVGLAKVGLTGLDSGRWPIQLGRVVIAIALMVIIGFGSLGADRAEAAPILGASSCRTFRGSEVCVLTQKRSAKRFWEYKAQVTVNGERQPLWVYNCRDRTKAERDGTVFEFDRDDPGDVICKVYALTKWRYRSIPGAL
jgi:hypothetical protein